MKHISSALSLLLCDVHPVSCSIPVVILLTHIAAEEEALEVLHSDGERGDDEDDEVDAVVRLSDTLASTRDESPPCRTRYGDVLTCGPCGATFPLAHIVLFIEHKARRCRPVPSDTCDHTMPAKRSPSSSPRARATTAPSRPWEEGPSPVALANTKTTPGTDKQVCLKREVTAAGKRFRALMFSLRVSG